MELDQVVTETEKLREEYKHIEIEDRKRFNRTKILALEGQTYELNKVLKTIVYASQKCRK